MMCIELKSPFPRSMALVLVASLLGGSSLECIYVIRWRLASRCVLFQLWAILAPSRLFLCESLGNMFVSRDSDQNACCRAFSRVGCFLEATSSLVVWLFHWCFHAFAPLRPAVTSCLWWVGLPMSSYSSSLWQRLWCMPARLNNIWVRNSLVKPWIKCAQTLQHFRIGL